MTDTSTAPPSPTLSGAVFSDPSWPDPFGLPSIRPVMAHFDVSPRFSGLRRHPWLGEAVERLDRLAALPPSWDEEGARPISSTLVEAVRAFVTSDLISGLTRQPDLVPTLEGGIQIEWHTEDLDLLIDCPSTGSPSMYFRDVNTEDEFEGPIIDGRTVLAKALIRLGHRVR